MAGRVAQCKGASDAHCPPDEAFAVRKFVRVRGLDYHVRTWGRSRRPTVFLLHGWMDVSASFQFLVDALSKGSIPGPGLARIRSSPRRRRTATGSPTTFADLDALVHALAPGTRWTSLVTASGGNVAMIYRRPPGKTAHIVSLDASGVLDPPGGAVQAAQVARRARRSAVLRALRDMAAVADRLQKNNRGCRARRPSGRAALGGGCCRRQRAARADPKHKLPFPVNAHGDDIKYAIWREIIACRSCGSSRPTPEIGRWVAPAAAMRCRIVRRFTHVPHGTLHFVADAGHMLHQ